ncbi:MAG: glycosyltransferase [Terrimonas sp.]|nr:glycosyltransferase [Terrimonas sp.]
MLISICIPAYKNIVFLEQLLHSISIQEFRDFEVIVSDDSPDQDAEKLCDVYINSFRIIYHRNNPALGTPENWNEAIRRANGDWIKIMHDDDWLSSKDSLSLFARSVLENPNASFFFSAYINIRPEGLQQTVRINPFRKRKLFDNAVTLFSRNVIGPPSVTMVRNRKDLFYDKRMKWMVDVDYYIRYLAHSKPVYIDQPLINVGIHQEQVTNYTFRIQEVEIPENFLLLEKVGTKHLKDLLIYDAWWRIVRNLKITSMQTVRDNGYHGTVPPIIEKMINWQSGIPPFLLRMGIFSKLIMFVHYMTYRNTIHP